MNTQTPKHTSQAIDIFLRLGLLVLLLFWCFEILTPFILPVLWGIIIAVAMYPLQHFLEKKLKLNQTVIATLLTLLMLAIIIVPASLFIKSLTTSIIELKSKVDNGTLTLSTPQEYIKDWPIIGNKLFAFLTNITKDIEQSFIKYQAEITHASKSVLNAIVGTGLSILQLLLSIIIAGILLATKGTEAAADKLFNKLIDNKGNEFVILTASTIRNVVKGVLGVAIIQSILAGFGLYLANIPHAEIWILACLIFSIVQIGPGIILIPAIIYIYSTADTLTAILWTVYFVVVLFSDNILKPILLGKGASVPMLVIFLGVIGGFLLQGFIGLFTGAIVLSVSYKLFLAWLDDSKPVVET
jgi:predicted PurR-regulated permease PerM